MLKGPGRYFRNKNLHLLIFLVIILLVFPFIEQYLHTDLPIISLIFLGGLTAAIWALNFPPKIFTYCAAVVACIFILEVVLKYLPPAWRVDIAFLTWVLYAVFTVSCIVLMMKKTFASKYVSIDTLVGGVNIYMLIAFFWAIVYHLVNVADAGAFNLDQRMTTTQLLYFSYTTISTLGFGDIVPTRGFSMVLTSLEAITGQLYVAVFVAMLVGLHITARNSHSS